mgnify:CR=1 FL=1
MSGLSCLFVVVFLPFFFPRGSHRTDYEHKLMKDLFQNYSKEARPVMNKSEAIAVKFDLAYSQLIYLVRR